MKRDTSSWTQAYRNERTEAARSARAEGVANERMQRDNVAIDLLNWMAWFGYTIPNIAMYLSKRSRRLLDWMNSEGLIYSQLQLARSKKRTQRHGPQYRTVAVIFPTKKGLQLSGSSVPARRMPDESIYMRHNLMVQLVAIHLMETQTTKPNFTAYTPRTQHLSIESNFYSKFKPDLVLDIEPPTVEEPFRLDGSHLPNKGTFYIEVERSKKSPAELNKFVQKLRALEKTGGIPVIACESAKTMNALLFNISETPWAAEWTNPITLAMNFEEDAPHLINLLD